MEKINIAELLRNCPQGVELDCTMFDYAILHSVLTESDYPIRIISKSGFSIRLTKYGQYANTEDAKCVIFPRGKTTWKGFMPPCKFKDGDIIYNQDIKATAIFYKQTDNYTISHCFLNIFERLRIPHCHSKFLHDWRLATEEEKQKLFDAIKANGFCWNSETKILEKLPKFKVGDRVKSKTNKYRYTIEDIRKDCYIMYYENDKFGYHVPFCNEDEFDLIPNKFDITTLKPFDKVLVRDDDKQEWTISYFSHCNDMEKYKYSCVSGNVFAQCVPYEENKYLFRTTNACSDFYRIWK